MHKHAHTNRQDIHAHSHACTRTHTQMHIRAQTNVHICTLAQTYMYLHVCTPETRVGTGQLPVLRAAPSTPISAAKALAYGEASCCRDGKSIKHPEENYTVRRDHIRRSVVVEVSPRPHPGRWTRAPFPEEFSGSVRQGPSLSVGSLPEPRLGQPPWVPPRLGAGEGASSPQDCSIRPLSMVQNRLWRVAWESPGLQGSVAAPTYHPTYKKY